MSKNVLDVALVADNFWINEFKINRVYFIRKDVSSLNYYKNTKDWYQV